MASSFTIMRVRGIPIGVHWSWLIIVGIFVWSLTKVLYPAAYPGLDGATYLGMGVATALLFFGSVLLHELSHALLSGARESTSRGSACGCSAAWRACAGSRAARGTRSASPGSGRWSA